MMVSTWTEGPGGAIRVRVAHALEGRTVELRCDGTDTVLDLKKALASGPAGVAIEHQILLAGADKLDNEQALVDLPTSGTDWRTVYLFDRYLLY